MEVTLVAGSASSTSAPTPTELGVNWPNQVPMIDCFSGPSSSSSSTTDFYNPCPANESGKLFTHFADSRLHFQAAHSKETPHQCAFSPSACEASFANLSYLGNHICDVHQQSAKEAMKDIFEQREVLKKDSPSETLEVTFVATSTKTQTSICKRPWSKCDKKFKGEAFYQIHKGSKLYKCTYPACTCTNSTWQGIKDHILNDHKQPKLKLFKYIEVDQQLLDMEKETLGLEKYKKVRKRVRQNNFPLLPKILFQSALFETFQPPTLLESPIQPTLIKTPQQPFFSINRIASTGHFVCPSEDCLKKFRFLCLLKNHYRVHRGPEFRPYRCIFYPVHCRYASNNLSSLTSHISFHHNIEQTSDWLNLQYFVISNNILNAEKALFENAQIIEV